MAGGQASCSVSQDSIWRLLHFTICHYRLWYLDRDHLSLPVTSPYRHAITGAIIVPPSAFTIGVSGTVAGALSMSPIPMMIIPSSISQASDGSPKHWPTLPPSLKVKCQYQNPWFLGTYQCTFRNWIHMCALLPNVLMRRGLHWKWYSEFQWGYYRIRYMDLVAFGHCLSWLWKVTWHFTLTSIKVKLLGESAGDGLITSQGMECARLMSI